MSLLGSIEEQSSMDHARGVDVENGEQDNLLRQSSADSSEQEDPPSVYKSIHRIRRLVIATLVRPLVNRLYDPDDPSLVYCLLANRIQFLREQSNSSQQTVSTARAALCELVAARVLRRFNDDHAGPIGLLLLAHILVEGFDPFQGAPPEIEEEYRHPQWPVQRRDGRERKLTTLELAIVSESKVFIGSSACQKVIDAVYNGRIVYTPISFVDILPDHYKFRPISLYDARSAPLLPHTRLSVPRIRAVIELVHFFVLVVLYVLTMTYRSSPRVSTFEWIFIIYTAGWVVDEFAAVIEHGWQVYTQTLWSFLDITFMVIFGAYVVGRSYDISVGSILNGMGLHILCTAAPVLLTRSAFALLPDNLVFISIHAMMRDFTVVTFLATWCFTGFLLALMWLNSNASPDFSPGWITVCKWLLWIWFGLDGTGFSRSGDFHPIFGPALMTAFAFLGNTLFVTILVALLTNTFSRIIADAAAEVQFRRTVLTFAGVKSDSIFAYPPPFNLLALLVLLPLKPLITPRLFHTVNVFVIRMLNFPILLVINSIERNGCSKAQRRTKNSFLNWNFSGFSPHGDVQAVFAAEPPVAMQAELEDLDALSDLGYAESALVSPRSMSRRTIPRGRQGKSKRLSFPGNIMFPLSNAPTRERDTHS
ncbi:nonselective cation channel [Seiridium cupressi]